MSRIGNRILTIPEQVEVKIEEQNTVIVKGPKGQLTQKFSPLIKIEINEKEIKTLRSNENKATKQLHGTTNSLLQGMLTGVATGFKKELQIIGVGYRANLTGNKLNLALGYSHPIEYMIPQGITVLVPKPTSVIVSGIDKQLVGQVAADIRSYRTPEPYKGKGVRYLDEFVIRKEGKAAGK